MRSSHERPRISRYSERYRRRSRLGTTPLVLAFLLSAGACQEEQSAAPTAVRLSGAERIPGEFATVTSLRELDNGSLILADAQEQRLVHVDPVSDRIMPVARAGRGPGEYEFVGWVVPVGRDLTLSADRTFRRALLFDGTAVVRTLPADHPLSSTLGYTLAGGDSLGRILLVRSSARRPGVRRPAEDSAMAILGPSDGAWQDTVARLRSILGRRQVVRRPGRWAMVTINPLQVDEQAVLCPDGWIALARAGPYRIDWRSPAGEVVPGTPVRERAVRVTAREKRAAMARHSHLKTISPDALEHWPRVMPPFTRDALVCAPDGHLLVHRMPTADDAANRYDVINRQGARVARIELPGGQRLVGAGRHVVYAVARDTLGVERLLRYAWPPGNRASAEPEDRDPKQ